MWESSYLFIYQSNPITFSHHILPCLLQNYTTNVTKASSSSPFPILPLKSVFFYFNIYHSLDVNRIYLGSAVYEPPHGEASWVCVCGLSPQPGGRSYSPCWRLEARCLCPWASHLLHQQCLGLNPHSILTATDLISVCVWENDTDTDQCSVWTQHALVVTLTDIHQRRRKSKEKRIRQWQMVWAMIEIRSERWLKKK